MTLPAGTTTRPVVALAVAALPVVTAVAAGVPPECKRISTWSSATTRPCRSLFKVTHTGVGVLRQALASKSTCAGVPCKVACARLYSPAPAAPGEVQASLAVLPPRRIWILAVST